VLTPRRSVGHLPAELPSAPQSPRSTRAPTRSSAWSWPGSSWRA